MTRISLNVIAKDEASTISKTLQSVRNFVDEMIVIDTGSTDKTKAIAIAQGARVYDFPWIDDFSAARNAALDHSRGEWILTLDADEYIANQEELRALLSRLQKPDTAYYFKRNLFDKEVFLSGSPIPFLFPNLPGIRWKYRVHEQISESFGALNLKSVLTTIQVNHPLREEGGNAKTHYYLALLEKDLQDFPAAVSVLYHLGAAYYKLKQYPKAIEALTKAADLLDVNNRLFDQTWPLLISSLYLSGRTTEGWIALKSARKIYPEDLMLLNFEASLLRSQGKLSESATLLEEIIALADKDDRFNPEFIRRAAKKQIETMKRYRTE